MPRYPTSGITALSQLNIDADKVWLTKGISNIKELALAMIQGDFLVHDGTRIIRFPAGIANMVLTSNGVGLLPSWQPGGTYFNRFFPASIYLTKALSVVPAAKSYNRNALLTSPYVDTCGDLPASYLKMLGPTINLVDAEAVVAPNKTYTKTPATVGRQYDLQIVVGGAVADDGGALSDETAAAQSAAANDMHLLPVAAVLGDAYDFGFDKMFDVMRLNIGTPGIGDWTITWKYWSSVGPGWVNLTDVVDGTSHFKAAAGIREVTFTRPVDWLSVAISGLNKYWIRAEITNFTSIATQPLGTQAWIRIIT
jgi:hypothetical protein